MVRRASVDQTDRSHLLAAAWWLLLPVGALAVLAAIPGALDAKLAGVLRGVCAQRPGHAIGFDTSVVVLEARMLGIFLGFLVAVLAAWGRGHWRRSELPTGLKGLLLLLGIGLMAADGINAALADLRQPYLYPPQNELRLATGLLCGLGMAAFIAPVVSMVVWRNSEPVALFASWTDLGWAAAWVTGAGVIVGARILAGPVLGIVAVLAVAGSFWLVSTYIAVLAWEGPKRMGGWNDLRGLATAGFVLTLAELFVMSAVRDWMEGSLGLSWVV